MQNKNLQMSYTLTINENYKSTFKQVDMLEEALNRFIKEIKESFTIESIKEYLNSHPSLTFKNSFCPEKTILHNENQQMTRENILSEVEETEKRQEEFKNRSKSSK